MTSTQAITDHEERTTVHGWQRWTEPWYLAYGLLGASAAGMLPILLPLTVSLSGSPAQVGLVMAAFSLGGLTAPLWGVLADRYRLHRWLLIGGLVLTTVGVTVFAFTKTPATWLGLALLQSIGVASAATVANLFVVEAHPQAEWDERIGWLQTFYGGGQVGGLLLAGILSHTNGGIGLLAAAGLTALGVLLSWFIIQTPPGPLAPKPVLLHPIRHGEWGSSPQRLYHHLTLKTLRQIGMAVRSPFGLFLVIWLAAFGGSAAVFSLYPVLMQHVFGIAPWLSSVAFALAAGLGLTLYSPAGEWSDRWGAAWVLRRALGLRLLAFLGMLALGLAHMGSQGWLALLAFTFVVLAWSLLSVSGTALTARLSVIGEGEGMGIFNAVTAVAGVMGAALGGWLAGRWGYTAALALAAVGVALGVLLTFGRVYSQAIQSEAKGR